MKYLGSTTDQKDFVRLEKLLSYGTTLGAASNALTLKNSAGTVLSTLTAANLVTVLGNTAVAVASKVGTATKGATNLPVYINAGTPTAVTSVGEAYLSWGGKNFSDSYGPIDAAMVPVLGANRSAFAKAAGIVVEYSRDGGDTWTDYGATDNTKTALFSGINAGLYIGKADSSHIATASYKLRVTLNTSAAGIYTILNKFVIYLSTNGSTGCTCTITARHQSDYESQIETWRTFADKVTVSGWSGYNVINTSGLVTYGNTKASHYGQVRFLFECTGGSTTTYFGLNLLRIYCFGGVGWKTPSYMAASGHIYTYDALQSATFPANITCANLYALANNTYNIGSTSKKWANVYAATFHGALNGNAATATKLNTARTIWGRSFDGSANVSGAMSDVTSLTMNGALAGATTGTFSSNLTVGGTLTMSGSNKRIYFGTDYIELVTVGGVKCLHSNVGFYSDSFVSAGGIGSGGGGGSNLNVKSLSEVVAYSGSEVMTDVPTAYAVHSMYNTFNTAIANVVKTQSNTFPPGSIALWTGSGKNLTTCTSVGNASKPIYLEDGIPKVCTHTLEKDVPSNAVFTDTHDTNVASTGISVSGTRGNTIAINSTYQTYISNGNTAHGWGNHANAGYLKSITASMVTTALGNTAVAVASKLGTSSVGTSSKPIYLNAGTPTVCAHTLDTDVPSGAVFTDTKNTAGSSHNNSTTLYLVGATKLTESTQTYSNHNCYIGVDNCLYSNGQQVETQLTKQRLVDLLGEPGDTIITVSNKDYPSSNYTKYAFTPEGLFARTVTLNNDGGYLPVAMPDINTEENVQPYRFMGRRVFKRALAVTDLVALMSGGGIDIMTKLGFSSPICLIGVRGCVIDEHGMVPIPQYAYITKYPQPIYEIYMSDVSGGYSKHLQLVIQYSTPTGGFIVLEYIKQFDGGDYYYVSGGGEPESPYPIIKDADWNESRMFKSPYTLQELSNGFEVYSAQGNWIRFTYQGDGIFQGDVSVEITYPVTVAFAVDGEINWLEAVDDYDHWFFNGHGLISPFPIRLVQ